MRYEPIGYVYEYELGALAVYLVIMLRYFCARRFPNQRNHLYSLIMRVTVADVILDVASSLIIDHVFRVPVVVTHLVNTSFYAITMLMLILMMVYAYALAGFINKKRLLRIIPLLLPGVVMFLMLACNSLTRWFFYIDPVRGYVHASHFWSIYAVCFVYLVFTLVIALRNRAILQKKELTTILLFLGVVLLSTVAQYFKPELLFIGVAIMLAVVLMYFTIQNPESMVDITTGAFTCEAMLTFLRDRVREHDHVQLVAIKIHNMPRINDLLGIDNGCLLLRQLCQFLAASANDAWIFRMRGSCFVAITRRTEDYTAIRTRLARHAGEPWIVNGTEVLLQASVCCMETRDLSEDPVSPEETVNYLETALAQKERGGERIANITAGRELLDKIKRGSAVESALRAALSGGKGLELYFQPLWSIRQERYVSAEVLLRFSHPVLGHIPPDEFITIAENNGFITALDEFVVRKACAFMREHDGMKSYGIESLQINLSALEFMHRRLPELLRDVMTQYGIDPRILCFEVTETAATESFQMLQSCMADIARLGCRFALDDFGTGYANISQVIRLPFSTVKLDKSLLNGPPAVLEDLARMFTRIDRKTVIEGVETAAQAKLVKRYELDVIQGFYYAKPMNGDALIRFLEKENGYRSNPDASSGR